MDLPQRIVAEVRHRRHLDDAFAFRFGRLAPREERVGFAAVEAGDLDERRADVGAVRQMARRASDTVELLAALRRQRNTHEQGEQHGRTTEEGCHGEVRRYLPRRDRNGENPMRTSILA